MLLSAHLLLAIAWITFCTLHSLLAADSVRQKIIPYLPEGPSFYRLLYTLFAAAGFIAIVLYQLSVRSVFLFRPTLPILVAGIAGGVGGAIMMGVCIARYFFQLSGLKGLFKKDARPVLLVNGLHRYMRHPLYMGTFIFIWSLFLLFPWLSLAVSNGIITIYTIIGAGLEERKLVKIFGADYVRYQERVPMFIPRIGKG